MRITNCNCGERVECGCTPRFSSYQTGTTSVLDVGELFSDGCTFEEYVIDWYRDGELQLVSGAGSHPDIEAYHPFTGAAAIPVPGGTYVPVIRFVVIAGEKIYSSPRNCQKWCRDLTGLPSIEVVSIGCGTTGGNAPANYDLKIWYSTSQDYSLASRTLRFDLPDDPLLPYLAVYYYAYSVADKLEVFLNGESAPLTSWIIGDRYNVYEHDAMPYKNTSVEMKFILAIPEYPPGSYLIIKVTPSVLENNVLTQWWIALKCLFVDLAGEMAAWNADMRSYDVNSFSLVQVPAECRWKLSFTMDNDLPAATLFQTLQTYLGLYNHAYGTAGYVPSTRTGYIYASYGRLGGNSWDLGRNSVWNTGAMITVTKAGNVFTFTFADQADRDVWYARWTALLATSWDNGYNPDNTSYDYYRFFRIDMRYTMTGCGDVNYEQAYYYFHISSVVTWGADFLRVEAAWITCNLPALPSCDSGYSNACGSVTSARNTFILADFVKGTVCRESTPITAYHCYYTDVKPTDWSAMYGHALKSKRQPPAQIPHWCQTTLYYYEFHNFRIRVVITDYADESRPPGNFIVYDGLDHDTGCWISWVKVFEMQNFVQIFP